MKILTTIFAAALLVVATSCSNTAVTTSPDGALSATVVNNGGVLTVAMNYDGSSIMDSTPLQLTINGETIDWQITSSSSASKSDTIELPVGEFDKKTINFTESEYGLRGVTKAGEAVDGSLFVRSYDKAMAYRFVLNCDGEYTIVESSPYLLTGDGGFMNPNNEREPLGPSYPFEIGTSKLTTPAIYDALKGYVLAIHESDLHNYPQLRLTEDKCNNSIKISDLESTFKGEAKLPWRTIMYGTDIADLHNNKAILQTFNKPAEGDFSWVEPGVSLWDFRVEKLDLGEFKYETDNKSYKRFIDFAARKGLKYFMIDAGWFERMDPLKTRPEVDIEDVVSYATSKDVGIILYYDLNYMKRDIPKVDFEVVTALFQKWGVKGIKYGFLGSEGSRRYSAQEKTRMSEEVVRIAAEHQLLIDFHDGPIPYSGLERTYPNYITREFCHAQLDRTTAFYPRAFVKTICANMLAGAIDQTNGAFSITTMDRDHRRAGPKNQYCSTVAAEAARVFMSHTGHLTMLVDAPDAYDQKADLFQVIADLPGRWDDSKYLDMQFDSHVSIARRSGDDWFAATVYNEAGGDSEMKLCFLDPARKYKATIYRDAADSHYVTNTESYEIESREVTSKDTIKVKVAPGGGFTISFKAL